MFDVLPITSLSYLGARNKLPLHFASRPPTVKKLYR
jgi:hypothetical protein